MSTTKKTPNDSPQVVTPPESAPCADAEATPSPVGITVLGLGLDELRISQDFESMAGVKKLLLTVPVRKPHRQEFIRVHPDSAWRLDTATLTVKDERKAYLVGPSVRDALVDEIVPATLFTTINRQGVVFLWPIPLAKPDGTHNPWHRSAFEAAAHAMHNWVRIAANLDLGAYEVNIAQKQPEEPVWPEEGFLRLVELAFKDGFINEPNHPVLRKLRGEV